MGSFLKMGPEGSGNRGVMALNSSLVALCLRAMPGANVKVLALHNQPDTSAVHVGDQVHQIPVIPCRLSPKSKFHDHIASIVFLSVVFRVFPLFRPRIIRANSWIRALVEADLIGDIRGGDSFSDIYGIGRFLTGFAMAWTVLLVKRDMVQLPQTYGPYQSRLAKLLARYILNNSSMVIARDMHSQRVAQELLRGNQRVLLSPDVAFSLEISQPSAVVLEPPLSSPSSGKIIGLNVNGLMYNGGYSRNNMFGLKLDYPSFLTSLALSILMETDRELWLVPHTFAPTDDVESDPGGSRKLRNSLPRELQNRVRIVALPYDQHQIKGIIGMCEFFIGSRMHACIAALSQGIPCVGVAYSGKFNGVFESVGMQDWVVDGRSVGNEEAVKQILELYGQRDNVRGALVRRANHARVQLTEIFRLFQNYLPSPS
jgi:colanic acid/amylovoran biosynthesis protein